MAAIPLWLTLQMPIGIKLLAFPQPETPVGGVDPAGAAIRIKLQAVRIASTW